MKSCVWTVQEFESVFAEDLDDTVVDKWVLLVSEVLPLLETSFDPLRDLLSAGKITNMTEAHMMWYLCYGLPRAIKEGGFEDAGNEAGGVEGEKAKRGKKRGVHTTKMYESEFGEMVALVNEMRKSAAGGDYVNRKNCEEVVKEHAAIRKREMEDKGNVRSRKRVRVESPTKPVRDVEMFLGGLEGVLDLESICNSIGV